MTSFIHITKTTTFISLVTLTYVSDIDYITLRKFESLMLCKTIRFISGLTTTYQGITRKSTH